MDADDADAIASEAASSESSAASPASLSQGPRTEYWANVGPEVSGTGDPAWIEGVVEPGGAYPGDVYTAVGRWRERLYPTGAHPADVNPHTLCRAGLRQALLSLYEVLAPSHARPAEFGQPVNDDPTVKAIVAIYEVLEWVHSFDELLRSTEKRYKRASDLDPMYGPYVEGAIGARNASHHGLRRVVGIVEVQNPIYILQGRRWVRTEALTPEKHLQVRWVRVLPGEPLRYKDQTAAFEEHLAGREVRNCINAMDAFFFCSVAGVEPPPGVLYSPASFVPPVDPDYARIAAEQATGRSPKTAYVDPLTR